jgi:NADPH-dependent 7-cyano-7-deazaguanine reductase QueF-like protein
MTNIQISLHDGTTITVGMDNYNAAELSTKLNDQKLLVVTVGDVIVNKNTIKMIAPAQ